jgi:hypothetical protein
MQKSLRATTFVGNTRETIVWVHGSFALLLSPLFSRHASNPEREPQGIKKMGRYQTEAAYLKSVLLWLQEYWTGPAVRIYPLRAVPQGSLHYDRRDVIIDLPAFLPPRNSSAHRQRVNLNLERAK